MTRGPRDSPKDEAARIRERTFSVESVTPGDQARKKSGRSDTISSESYLAEAGSLQGKLQAAILKS